MQPSCLLTAALCLLAVNHRSFVDTAALGKSQEPSTDSETSSTNTQLQDSNVRELESLKHSLGKTLAMMKSHSSEYSVDSNGHQKLHSDTREELNTDGKLVASVDQQVDSDSANYDKQPITKVRTQVDIPSQGIHHTLSKETGQEPVITENGNRRGIMPDMNQDLNNNLNKYTSYSGVQYSPLDMAEYVFWTGDEKGVTMAIEEFLQEGLMTREEAIVFLQEIKYNLDYLQSHYSKQGLQEHSKERTNAIQKYMLNKPQTISRMRDQNRQPEYDMTDIRQELNKKSDINENQDLDLALKREREREREHEREREREQSAEDEDYEELLEKLRLADLLYTEYSLEEIIYQLSKIMFTQSLTRGSAEAQAALQKFTGFLETEAEAGHISRALEKKVLDVLIAALTDTLTEHPELVPAAREGLGGGAPNLPDSNRLLQKLLEIETLDKTALKSPFLAPYRVQQNNKMEHAIRQQINESPISKSTPLGIGKYKNP